MSVNLGISEKMVEQAEAISGRHWFAAKCPACKSSYIREILS